MRHTVYRAHSPDQAQGIAIPDQEAERILVLGAGEIVRPPVETTGRGHSGSQIGLTSLISSRSQHHQVDSNIPMPIPRKRSGYSQ